MKKGKCPKCGSSQIFKRKGVYYRSFLNISFFKLANTVDYVCTDCGYTEAYVLPDRNAIEYIKNNWEKV